MIATKLVLFDRDGTLIIDPPDLRVDRIDKIKLFPDTIAALKLLAGAGYAIILVTNQAGIGEGLLNKRQFEKINAAVVDKLATSGIQVLKTFMCPHTEQALCDCRKPKPKLLLDAAQQFGLDLSVTYMVGDRQSDILAGIAAGTKTILVSTGNAHVTSSEANYTAATLTDAVQHILGTKARARLA